MGRYGSGAEGGVPPLWLAAEEAEPGGRLHLRIPAHGEPRTLLGGGWVAEDPLPPSVGQGSTATA